MKTVEQRAEIGIIVARFQSPFLHEGHVEILNTVTSAHPKVIVFLGLSPLKCTFRNPYDFATRRAMVQEKYPDVEVNYIEDVGDNELWSKNLDRLIAKSVAPGHKTVLYGGRDSFIKAYCGKFPTIELLPSKFISASEIRKEAGIKVKHTLDFRLGINHAVQNQFPSFKATVDMAIINFETGEILFARKPNRNVLCFPGGFTDPLKDKSAEDAAIREAKEETGLDTTVEAYAGSLLVNDGRYRDEQDKIMTFIYIMRYNGGTPVASDDIEFVTWKPLRTFDIGELSANHQPILARVTQWMNNNVWSKPIK